MYKHILDPVQCLSLVSKRCGFNSTVLHFVLSCLPRKSYFLEEVESK